MRLIIGGAYQGKLEFAMEEYGKTIVADGRVCSIEDTFFCEILDGFETFIRRNFNTLDESTAYLGMLSVRNPDVIIISTEVGNGIVPVDKSERDYRELIGRVCCEISKRAQTVERVFCGLGVFLKC